MSIAEGHRPPHNTLNDEIVHPTGPRSNSASGDLSAPCVSDGRASPVTNWSAAKLGVRLASDASSAASASILIAPIVTVIDRSIIQKASTGTAFRDAFLRSIQPIYRAPHQFFGSKPFMLVFSLYFSTYLTANAIDTATSIHFSTPATSVTTSATKFVATSAVNMTLCVYKDSCFVKIFGAGIVGPGKATVPKLSYALFAARDCLTIFASFNLPPLIAPRLANLPPAFKACSSRLLATEKGRTNTAQFIAPAAMQLFSTPIHLLGLDLFNRQAKLQMRERVARVWRDWGVSAFARMGRIVPAFGIGGIVNANVRKSLMGRI